MKDERFGLGFILKYESVGFGGGSLFRFSLIRNLNIDFILGLWRKLPDLFF